MEMALFCFHGALFRSNFDGLKFKVPTTLMFVICRIIGNATDPKTNYFLWMYQINSTNTRNIPTRSYEYYLGSVNISKVEHVGNEVFRFIWASVPFEFVSF